MEGFVKINNSLINMERLLALHHKPKQNGGSFQSAEHYIAVFDTGKELWLSPEDGSRLLTQYQDLYNKPPDGMIATTSDSAI